MALLQVQKLAGCPKRLVAYVCEATGCGGTGDRAQGFAAVVALALMSGSQFGMRWSYPVYVRECFDLPETTTENDEVQLMMQQPPMNLIDNNDWVINGFPVWLERNLRRGLALRCNPGGWPLVLLQQDYKAASRAYGLDGATQTFGVIWRMFFSRPKPLLRTALSKALEELGSLPRVTVAVRVGGINDPKRHKSDCVKVFVVTARQACKDVSSTQNCSYLVSSDAPATAAEVHKLLAEADPGAKIMVGRTSEHIDRGVGVLTANEVQRWLPHYEKWFLICIRAVPWSPATPRFPRTAAFSANVSYLASSDPCPSFERMK